jgi:hypothetical protein
MFFQKKLNYPLDENRQKTSHLLIDQTIKIPSRRGASKLNLRKKALVVVVVATYQDGKEAYNNKPYVVS